MSDTPNLADLARKLINRWRLNAALLAQSEDDAAGLQYACANELEVALLLAPSGVYVKDIAAEDNTGDILVVEPGGYRPVSPSLAARLSAEVLTQARAAYEDTARRWYKDQRSASRADADGLESMRAVLLAALQGTEPSETKNHR